MNRIPQITFTTILLTILSCKNYGQASNKSAQSTISDTLKTEDKNTGIKIDYNKTKVLLNVYVVDRNGTEVKQQADKNSKTLGRYDYGTKLGVIEDNREWFGVRERITREFIRNGSIIESTGWEKVYILKNQTGSIKDIYLIPSDLNIISSLSTNQKTENFETSKKLEGFLKIELIDKQLFESKRSSSVNFLLTDTTEIKKKNGTIELKCKSKVVKYIDKPNEEESMQIFHYVGQFEFLNKYLIGGSYYEGQNYIFVDKTSGEETQTFGEYPIISADKKHIICIYANHYENTADLELYSINNKQIKHKMSASFKNWMPTVDSGEIFWSTDHFLYLTVKHVNTFWKQDGNLNDKCQYIRIKIL